MLKHSGLATVADRPRSGESCQQGVASEVVGRHQGGVQGVEEHKALPTGRIEGQAPRVYRSPSLDSPYRISSVSTIYFICTPACCAQQQLPRQPRLAKAGLKCTW